MTMRAGGFGRYGRRSGSAAETPVELRFVDLLLIVVATVMFMAVLLIVVSAFTSTGRPDVAPRITTVSAPSALVGQPYQLTLAADGEGPLSWRLVQGTLPAGLSLDPAGMVRGTAADVEQQVVTVGVQDGQHRTDRRDLLVSTQQVGLAAARPTLPRMLSPTALLRSGTAGRAYRYAFSASPGTPPLRWRLVRGSLPAGISLTADGVLVGSPRGSGTSDFTVSVTDGTGATARQHVRLVVRPAPGGWWGRLLSWLWRIVTYTGYLLVLVTMLTLIFGAAPSAGHRGLVHVLSGRG